MYVVYSLLVHLAVGPALLTHRMENIIIIIMKNMNMKTPAKIGNRIGKTISLIPRNWNIESTKIIGIMMTIQIPAKIRGLGL